MSAAAAEDQWVQLLDESSNTFYYTNIVTQETSWDAPQSFMHVAFSRSLFAIGLWHPNMPLTRFLLLCSKHEDIQTSFDPSAVAQHEEIAVVVDDIPTPDPEQTSAESSVAAHVLEQQQVQELAAVQEHVAPSLIDSEPLPQHTQIAPLVPQPLLPEVTTASVPELLKKKVAGYDASAKQKQHAEFPTESHPLFEFASKHCSLVSAPAKTTLLCFPFPQHKPQKHLLDLRTRLYWENGLISAPITQLPKTQTKVALQAFRNISGFMGNRSSGKGQIDHCFKLLRNVATKSHDLKDEIYCQLCKQLTGNPDVNAVLNGWLLLNVCLITFPPSKELAPYLDRFFAQHVGAAEPEIAQYATDGLHSLQSSYVKGDRKELPCPMEIQALRDHSLIEITVSLVDDMPIKASVSAWTTCSELLKIITERLGIRKTQAFALFEASNFQEERVIEGDERILDLYALWERIGTDKEPKKKNAKASAKQKKKAESERTYRLVYKIYLWIDFDDELVEEVGMLYLQAVHNIVNGIYVCTLDKCVELASYQLYCRHGAYQSDDQKVYLLAEIKQHVPQSLLSPANRQRICDQVLAAYSALSDDTNNSSDTSLRQCKLAYLRICKTPRFYGATFFAAQNMRNPKMPSEVVLAVDYKGLSIVSVENEAALAHFLYADIASWGYSANSFVFVVAHANEEETEHVLKTSAGKHVNDIIVAYVKYIVTLTS